MGARPEQQLALNFLAAVHDLWIQHPGTYQVEESVDDLVPALAQMCIKALASDVRDDDSTRHEQQMRIDGILTDGDQVVKGGPDQPSLTLRDTLNKAIHGIPAAVEVRDDGIWLRFNNSSANEGWTEVRFSGTQLLKQLEAVLYKHRNQGAEEREREIRRFLATLGVERFLPHASDLAW